MIAEVQHTSDLSTISKKTVGCTRGIAEEHLRQGKHISPGSKRDQPGNANRNIDPLRMRGHGEIPKASSSQ